MKILVATDNDLPERVISLGAFTGKLQQGTGQLQVTFALIQHQICPLNQFVLSPVGFPRRSSKYSQND